MKSVANLSQQRVLFRPTSESIGKDTSLTWSSHSALVFSRATCVTYIILFPKLLLVEFNVYFIIFQNLFSKEIPHLGSIKKTDSSQ